MFGKYTCIIKSSKLKKIHYGVSGSFCTLLSTRLHCGQAFAIVFPSPVATPPLVPICHTLSSLYFLEMGILYEFPHLAPLKHQLCVPTCFSNLSLDKLIFCCLQRLTTHSPSPRLQILSLCPFPSPSIAPHSFPDHKDDFRSLFFSCAAFQSLSSRN